MPRKHGIFSELQLKVLRLRIEEGLSQAEVADLFKTSRENITIIEGRARKNIKLAQETLLAYRLLNCAVKIKIEPGTHLLEIPRILGKGGG